VKLPLSVADVYTVLVDGVPHVVFRPAVEALGMDYATQKRKIQGRTWATIGSAPMVAADGRTRDMDTITYRTFGMWASSVNENRVKDSDVRKRLVAFQCETADAIEAYWLKGGAVNPRATSEQLEALQTKITEQSHAIKALAPDAHAWRVLVSQGCDYDVRIAALILNRDPNINTGQNRLFALMRQWKMLDSKNKPITRPMKHMVARPDEDDVIAERLYEDFTDKITRERRNGGSQARITVKGLKYLHKKLGGTTPVELLIIGEDAQ
jgi:hypothetical protein